MDEEDFNECINNRSFKIEYKMFQRPVNKKDIDNYTTNIGKMYWLGGYKNFNYYCYQVSKTQNGNVIKGIMVKYIFYKE